MDWLDELNHEQRRAACASDGPLLIVAGPGTGKTKTLTTRIAYLLASGKAMPDEILALTFTNKAADEMHRRIGNLLGKGHHLPQISTFHALCYRLLSRAKNDPIRFINEHERSLIIKELRKAAELKSLTTRELALEVSRLKNLPPDETIQDSALANLVQAYNRTLQERNLHDFDDLLQQTYDLLQNQPIGDRYKYILVDEFQDTNMLQYELLGQLRSNDNICVIGDPLQSIYGFRGASSDVFGRFQVDFPNATSITLTVNYRSTPQVVDVANAIFPHSPRLQAQTQRAGQVRVVEVLNEYSEAAWAIGQIEAAIGGTDFLRSHGVDQAAQHPHRTFRDYVILYRTHHVGKVMRQALVKSGIPYQVVGDGSPYERPQTWAIMQLLCYLAEPTSDREAALESLSALKDFSKTQRAVLLAKLQKQIDQKLSSLAAVVAETFGLELDSQFLGTLIRFEGQGLVAYVAYADGLSESDFYDPQADTVTLMSIHAAKGLEFTYVFLIASEEEILPHKRRSDDEEERRLFYVAATRARENLDILHAKTRAGKGAEPSRFIKTLSPAVLERTQDESLADQQRKRQKRLAKHRQATLFDLP